MSPEEIERREFSSSLRGFDKTEVRDFLRRVARDITQLQTELTNRPSSPVSPPAVEAPVPAAEPAAVQPAALDTDDDRFEVLGDRIAGLLRNAHESAAQLRDNAESEAAETIKAAHDEAERIRVEAQREADEVRSGATAEVERIRQEAEEESSAKRQEVGRLELLAQQQLTAAETDAQALRDQAAADGQAEVDARRAELTEMEQAAQADRDAALAELSEARGQVSALLGEARAQSDFIRHEAEEIIRAKIRANVDQAEQRINMLRNSEVASRERIARAREELSGALDRLDSEMAPELPANAEQVVLEEAYERSASSGFPAVNPVSPQRSGDEAEISAPDADVEEATYIDVVETSTIEASTAPAETEAAEADVVETAVYQPGGALPSDFASDSGAATGSGSGDLSFGEGTDAGDVDATDSEIEPQNEDALARLVREAMQRAVDDARSSKG